MMRVKAWVLTDEIRIPEIGEWYLWANNTITKRMPEETKFRGPAVRIVKAYEQFPEKTGRRDDGRNYSLE
uniref:Uncharacterized protein n=2 Tax=viral metagenome TaxID=1070528 RepID=A0A6M3X6Z0_9ZZZZ